LVPEKGKRGGMVSPRQRSAGPRCLRGRRGSEASGEKNLPANVTFARGRVRANGDRFTASTAGNCPARFDSRTAAPEHPRADRLGVQSRITRPPAAGETRAVERHQAAHAARGRVLQRGPNRKGERTGDSRWALVPGSSRPGSATAPPHRRQSRRDRAQARRGYQAGRSDNEWRERGYLGRGGAAGPTCPS